MRRFWVGLAMAVPLAGLAACASEPIDPAIAAAASRPITCSAGADCDAKWSRAVGWIAQNSAWKIQTQTNDLIQTYNAPNNSDVQASYTVSKIANADGTYSIIIRAGCANMFGCVPDAVISKAAFVNFVDPPK